MKSLDEHHLQLYEDLSVNSSVRSGLESRYLLPPRVLKITHKAEILFPYSKSKGIIGTSAPYTVSIHHSDACKVAIRGFANSFAINCSRRAKEIILIRELIKNVAGESHQQYQREDFCPLRALLVANAIRRNLPLTDRCRRYISKAYDMALLDVLVLEKEMNCCELFAAENLLFQKTLSEEKTFYLLEYNLQAKPLDLINPVKVRETIWNTPEKLNQQTADKQIGPVRVEEEPEHPAQESCTKSAKKIVRSISLKEIFHNWNRKVVCNDTDENKIKILTALVGNNNIFSNVRDYLIPSCLLSKGRNLLFIVEKKYRMDTGFKTPCPSFFPLVASKRPPNSRPCEFKHVVVPLATCRNLSLWERNYLWWRITNYTQNLGIGIRNSCLENWYYRRD